ncbi:cysteine-rich CWC family protein [Halopseudomonas sp.]|uniref:cysteine-rich CWC family protein n=1 Tax=Halopseudomonas sp. TaxID=2901191 RepID=UPI003001F703
MTGTPLPNTLCPLCNSANQCVPAAENSFAGPCWCQNVTVSPQAIAAVPASQVGQACLCPRCAVGLRSSKGIQALAGSADTV